MDVQWLKKRILVCLLLHFIVFGHSSTSVTAFSLEGSLLKCCSLKKKTEKLTYLILSFMNCFLLFDYSIYQMDKPY